MHPQGKRGETYVGFITEESVDKFTLRNIAGIATETDCFVVKVIILRSK